MVRAEKHMFYKYAYFCWHKCHCHGNESHTFTNGKVGILTETWGAFWDKAPNYKIPHPTKIIQARIQGGGGKGALAPPPPCSGKKTRGPKTTHTEKKIKIGQPRSKIQAKTYLKKILVRWGGGGHKGKYFVHKSNKCTLKNIYNTPQNCSGMLKIAPKALNFLKFLGGGPPSPPPPPEERATAPPPLPYLPCGVSPRLLFNKK